VRNFLFGEPTVGAGFDLAALNIQRGRDHGLGDYNSLRVAYGLPSVSSFSDITSDVNVQAALQSVYSDVNHIDPWVGALAEDHLADNSLGPLLTAALVDQFNRARDGDRFWFELDPSFTPDEILQLQSVRLGDIIRANTGLTNLQRDVFFVPEPSSIGCLTILAWLVLARRVRSWRQYKTALPAT
jgi:hypothetical protein